MLDIGLLINISVRQRNHGIDDRRVMRIESDVFDE